MADVVTINIPKPLIEKIKRRAEETGVSVSEYIIRVLRETMAKLDEEEKEPFTKEDEERIKERLRSLGYID